MSENVSTNIFQSNAQLLSGIDPSKIRPMEDIVIIEDLPENEQYPMLVLPDGAELGLGKKGLLRIGRVLAVGRGDRFRELGLDRFENVRRKLLPQRAEMQVKVGDRVAYDRRKDCEFYVDGNRRVTLAHEEQAVLAVLED